MILSVIRSNLVRAALRARPMVYLGEISYSIYLVHFPILLGIHLWSVQTGVNVPGDSRLYLMGLLLVVIAMASITYRLIEVPGRRFLAGLTLRRGDNDVTATTA